MRLKKFGALVLALVLVLLPGSVLAGSLSVNVIHINDSHSHFEASSSSLYFNGVQTYMDIGGISRVVSKVDGERAAASEAGRQSLLLHAGDAVQGTLYYRPRWTS